MWLWCFGLLISAQWICLHVLSQDKCIQPWWHIPGRSSIYPLFEIVGWEGRDRIPKVCSVWTTADCLNLDKVLSGMAESLCFDRVEGQACGHSSWAPATLDHAGLFFHLADPQPNPKCGLWFTQSSGHQLLHSCFSACGSFVGYLG